MLGPEWDLGTASWGSSWARGGQQGEEGRAREEEQAGT